MCNNHVLYKIIVKQDNSDLLFFFFRESDYVIRIIKTFHNFECVVCIIRLPVDVRSVAFYLVNLCDVSVDQSKTLFLGQSDVCLFL